LVPVVSLCLPPNHLVLMGTRDAFHRAKLWWWFLQSAWAAAESKGQSMFISCLEAGFVDPEV